MTDKKTKDLQGAEAIDKMKELATEAKTCFFCTDIKTGVPLSVRPMTILEVDDAGNFWFMNRKDSLKEEEVSEDPFVHLLMQGGKRAGFLNVYGIAEQVDDKEKVDELWSKPLEIWFDGPDDPSISLLKVVPYEGHYWDNEHAAPVATFKMLTSILTGENHHDGIQGDLEV
ncbi:pyridoxamine 5'-phosphate oxidase family protein [Olivibacter sitiensis]|uniref:pyridoxamine 5'-phosphate oxidase family protein n=1 Tax=Olivibacter sitiensis TaxID=376470 RepID=UPI0003FF3998|nr:pyridoxamine 5'-phosphate oxidase family protein [Olivibacter sitiensis]